MKAYFEELQPDYMFEFVDENEPLGTAGSLQLLMGKFDKPFFVTNCDIIVKFGIDRNIPTSSMQQCVYPKFPRTRPLARPTIHTFCFI